MGSATCKSHPQTTYTIHRDLLTSASPFFAAALNGTFAEGLDQVVRLPEEKPEIFEWFIWWLYTGSLVTPAQGHGPECNADPHSPCPNRPPVRGLTHVLKRHLEEGGGGGGAGRDALPFPPSPTYGINAVNHAINALTHTDGDLRNAAGSPKYFLLLDLYGLSDRMLTASLSNHICDTVARLSETTNSVPTPSDTWILYDSIRDTAPIRRLVLDLFAYKKTDKLLEGHRDEWHPRFLRELVVKLKRPGPEAMDRHALVSWRPRDWAGTKACEVCRELLKPGISGEKCEVCERAFCGGCARNARAGNAGGSMYGGGGVIGGEPGACKPWIRGGCGRYHEHGV